MSREKANERINGRISPNDGKKSSTKVVIIIAVVIILILIGVILYLLLRRGTDSDYNMVVTPDNVEEIMSLMSDEQRTPIGSYQVTMNTSWVFPDGQSASTNAQVENSVYNQNTVYFTIALASDEDTDIYRSPYLMVGSHLDNIKLDTVLDAGTYDSVLTYHLVDDDYEEVSTVSVALTLTIDN